MYRILDPATGPDPRFRGLCALTVMAKAPRAGMVKTRLSPPLTPLQAVAISICFLQDTTKSLAEVAAATGQAAGLVSYTPIGEESLFEDHLPEEFHLIPQRGDGFGERLLHTAQDVLTMGFSSVCLIDSDSPTVPGAAYTQAIAELQRPGDRVVLGPSHDGGYFLIGLKVAHSEPFTNISWSTHVVAEETRARCRTASIELVELPLWYDVDDAASLDILAAELLTRTSPFFATIPGFHADNTSKFLSTELAEFVSNPNAGMALP